MIDWFWTVALCKCRFLHITTKCIMHFNLRSNSQAVPLFMYFGFLCTSWRQWICWTSSTCADPEEKNTTENSSGGSLGQGFRFSQLALSTSCCFFIHLFIVRKIHRKRTLALSTSCCFFIHLFIVRKIHRKRTFYGNFCQPPPMDSRGSDQ